MGFRALVEALEAGCHVRTAVRSQSKAELILTAPSIEALNPGSKLYFVKVSDILADGTYDKAFNKMKFIVHIASPLAFLTNDYKCDIIGPAIKIKSVANASSVKRIVITSS